MAKRQKRNRIATETDIPFTEPSFRGKILHTAIISCVYFILGIFRAQEGVVFLDLLFLTNSDIVTGSFLFTAGAVGFLVGVVVIGPLYDKVNNDILYCVCISLAGVTTVIIPWCKSIYLMIAVFGLRSLFVGPSDSGSSVICSKIWLKEAGPYLQNLLFLFSIGGIVAPFITQPFLVQDDGKHFTNASGSINMGVTNTRTEIHGEKLNETNIRSPNNASLNLYAFDKAVSYVYVAFAIAGGLLLAASLSLGVKIAVSSSGEYNRFMESKDEVNVQRPDPLASFPLAAKISCYTVLAIVYFSQGCIEKILTNLLMTFAVEHLQWSKSNGSMATTLFWAGLAVGRFLGIILIKILKPTALLIVSFIGLIITFSTMLLLDCLSWSNVIWWILFPTSGFFLSPVCATLYCWLDSNLTPLSGKLLSYAFVWLFTGTMTHMSLLGYLIEEISPVWFVYLLLIHACILMTSGVILFVTVRRFKRLYCAST